MAVLEQGQNAGTAIRIFFRHDVRAADAKAAPLVGSGTIQADRGGIAFSGRRPLPVVPTLVGVAFGLFTLGMLVAFFDWLGWAEHLNGKGMFLVGLVGGIAPGALARSLFMSHVRGRRLEAFVPWSQVDVTHADATCVELRLRHPDLEGDLALEPRDEDARARLAVVFPAQASSGAAPQPE